MAILACHGTLRNARVPGHGHRHRHPQRRWLRASAAEGADVARAGGEHLFDDSSSGGENAEVGKVWEKCEQWPSSNIWLFPIIHINVREIWETWANEGNMRGTSGKCWV